MTPTSGFANSVDILPFLVTNELYDSISVHSSVTLTQHEKDLFLHCLQKITRQFHREGKSFAGLRFSVFFTADGSYQIVNIPIEKALGAGHAMYIVVYAIESMRKAADRSTQPDVIYYLCFIEELAHCIWGIWDEHAVKRKVYDVFYALDEVPLLTFDEFMKRYYRMGDGDPKIEKF